MKSVQRGQIADDIDVFLFRIEPLTCELQIPDIRSIHIYRSIVITSAKTIFAMIRYPQHFRNFSRSTPYIRKKNHPHPLQFFLAPLLFSCRHLILFLSPLIIIVRRQPTTSPHSKSTVYFCLLFAAAVIFDDAPRSPSLFSHQSLACPH